MLFSLYKEGGVRCRHILSMVNGAKNWVFTLNNYSEQDVARLRECFGDETTYQYAVFGREVGKCGTRHLQGAVCCTSRRSLQYVRRTIDQQAHFEIMRGTPAQAAEYCKKDGQYEEFGTLPSRKRGHRSDLESMYKAIKSGASKRQVIEEHFSAYSRATRAANECFLLYAPTRNWKTEVTVYWGETGTGKSRRAFAEAGSDLYVHPGGQWFDGYQYDPVVLFDDFGGSEFKLTYLLKLLDRYPMRVPVKGAFVSWVPKKIIITSNYSPREWYPNAKEESVKALLRRIEKRVHFRRLSTVLHCPDLDDDTVEVIE